MDSRDSPQNLSSKSSRECEEAIRLGIEFLAGNEIEPALYKLIAAENLITGGRFIGPHAWRLTFKLRRLIPDSADVEIGAGGEVFIEVDMITAHARLLGHGE